MSDCLKLWHFGDNLKTESVGKWTLYNMHSSPSRLQQVHGEAGRLNESFTHVLTQIFRILLFLAGFHGFFPSSFHRSWSNMFGTIEFCRLMSHWREKIIVVVARMLFACEWALTNQNTSHWPIRSPSGGFCLPPPPSWGLAEKRKIWEMVKSEIIVKICIPTVKVTYSTSFMNMPSDE